MVCAPPPLNAAQAVRPSGGVSFTPAAVEPISLRGYETLNAPSFSSSLPLSPVSCSIFAVSNLAAGCAASETHAGEAKQFLPAGERSAGARNCICHRSTRMPVAAEVAEVELV